MKAILCLVALPLALAGCGATTYHQPETAKTVTPQQVSFSITSTPDRVDPYGTDAILVYVTTVTDSGTTTVHTITPLTVSGLSVSVVADGPGSITCTPSGGTAQSGVAVTC